MTFILVKRYAEESNETAHATKYLHPTFTSNINWAQLGVAGQPVSSPLYRYYLTGSSSAFAVLQHINQP